MHVFEAASDGEQGVAARYRSAAPRPFESAADNVLAGAFQAAGADRQSAHSSSANPCKYGTVSGLRNLRVLCRDRHDAVDCSRPYARARRSRATPEPIHAEPCRS